MHKIITTEDGSHTLVSSLINDTYHSVHGAIDEAELVYIKNGFQYVIEKGVKEIFILEIGLGTGLNCFLTLKKSIEDNLSVKYYAIEAYPIEIDCIEQLNYSNLKGNFDFFLQIHNSKPEEWSSITEKFSLFKQFAKVQEVKLVDNTYDVVYYDAFGPDKQAEMWTSTIFAKIYNSMKSGGVLVTYSTKGDVKRALKSVGFTIEKIPGPKGKREVLRAFKK